MYSQTTLRLRRITSMGVWCLALLMMASGGLGLAQPLVVVDAGHGGRDPGAVGCGREEATHVLDVAQRTKAFLETAGLRAELTRANDTYVELQARAAFANQRQASAFVSIHANANSGTAASGTETWIADAAGASSLSLAQALQTELVATWGLRDRGVKRANFTVLTATNMPAALTEIGFINRCDQDSELIGDPTERQEIARAHAIAISSYLNAGDIGEPGGTSPPSELPGTLIGVTFEDTGAGLDDPSVRLSGVQVTVVELNLSERSASSTGAWSFEVPSGTYTVRASLAGYRDTQRVCQVSEGQNAWCSLGLTRQVSPPPGGVEMGGAQVGGDDMAGGEAGGTPPPPQDMGPAEPEDLGSAGVMTAGVEAPIGGEPMGAGVSGTPELPLEGGASVGGDEVLDLTTAKKKDSGCQASPGGAPALLSLCMLLIMGLRRRLSLAPLLISSVAITLTAPPVHAHLVTVTLSGEVVVEGAPHEGGRHLKEARVVARGEYAKALLSPSGELALLVHRDQATVSILELSTGAIKALTHVQGAGRDPRWHPDSEGVALHSPEQSAEAVPLIHLNLDGVMISPPLSSKLRRRELLHEAIEAVKTQLAPVQDELFYSRVNELGFVVVWGLRTGLWLYRESDMSVFSLGSGGHPMFSGGGRLLTFERTVDDGASLRGGDLFYVELAHASPSPIALTRSAERIELAPHVVGGQVVFLDAEGQVWLAELSE